MLYLGHAYVLQNELQLAKAAYYRSAAIRKELDQSSLSMEPIAGLVEVFLRENDLEAASVHVETIFRFLESGGTLDGTEEPLRIYYVCYLFLQKKQDPRARQILQAAVNLLDAQVSNFSDETARQRYIENIPWRRAIRDGARGQLD
jgi:hypothetical protein